jgi:hypothetical protein
MATIQDHMTGKVCEQIKQALLVVDSVEGSLKGTEFSEALLNNINKSEPKQLTIEEAIKLIQESKQCAIGERVCRCLNKETPLTESVFLDDLAAGMVEAGKARFVTKDEAIDNVRKYQKSPIIVSKVSGKHSEICPTWPKTCLYWNMEKHKLKCTNR